MNNIYPNQYINLSIILLQSIYYSSGCNEITNKIIAYLTTFNLINFSTPIA